MSNGVFEHNGIEYKLVEVDERLEDDTCKGCCFYDPTRGEDFACSVPYNFGTACLIQNLSIYKEV